MTDVIGYAGQIIEVIQAIRGVYIRVKGLGKEIDDAMFDCGNMETDVLTLKKLFNKQTSNKFPEQVDIITKEFKSLHKSMKKLKKLFREYEKISLKWYGKLVWAYDKPRETIQEIRDSFSSYRGIFIKALHIINEGHNKDQERALRELKEQAKKASDERKEADKETKRKLKAMDERNKRDSERLEKLLRELMAKNQATPENRSKAVEGWLVQEKGMGREEAKSCASTALKEGKVPTVKSEEAENSKPKPKPKPKKAENEGAVAKPSPVNKEKELKKPNDKTVAKVSDEKVKISPPSKKADVLKEPAPGKLVPVSVPKGKSAPVDAKKPKTSNNGGGEKSLEAAVKPKVAPKVEAPTKKAQVVAPKKDEKKSNEKTTEAPMKKQEKKDASPKPAQKQKVPVIVIQDAAHASKQTAKDKIRSQSPSPSMKSSASTIAIVGKSKPRASSVSSGGSGKSSGSGKTDAEKQKERERIEKGMRYVKEGEKRGRSQEPSASTGVGRGLPTKDTEKRSRSEVRMVNGREWEGSRMDSGVNVVEAWFEKNSSLRTDKKGH